MTDEGAHRRYVHINLPHVGTIVGRLGRSLEHLGAFGSVGNGSAADVEGAFVELESEALRWGQDPPFAEAIAAADHIAELGRVLVAAVLSTPIRGELFGRHVRNLFECLGLADEGRALSLKCGESADSPLR